MSVEQLEQSVLKLSEAERRQFADWFYQHEPEIIGLPEDDDVHPSVKAEILRRSAELAANPGLAEPVTDEWFEQLKRKLADARPGQASAR